MKPVIDHRANAFNGLNVSRSKAGCTIFVPLPAASQTPIPWGCDCTFCKAHPERTPMWDTMAVAVRKNADDRTWTVHYPELHR